MSKLLLSIPAACLVLSTFNALAQNNNVMPQGLKNEYARLLRTSKFVENYKESAVVSARVFAARAQGSDKEFARFMQVVSTADLSDVEGCFANLYSRNGLTATEALKVSSFFESPLGNKILRASQQMLIGDIERGYHAPLPADTFTNEERQLVKDAYQNAAFSKYSRIVASKEFASGTFKCVASSKDVQRSGIKF